MSALVKKNGKRRAALYCRVARMDDWAVKVQRDTLRSFAEQHGYTNCFEFWDNGYNGLDLIRPAFAQMEAAIDAGEIDTIIVRSIDRISRNYLQTGQWLENLPKRGARLVALDGTQFPAPFPAGLGEHFKQFAKKKRTRKNAAALGN